MLHLHCIVDELFEANSTVIYLFDLSQSQLNVMNDNISNYIFIISCFAFQTWHVINQINQKNK